MSWRSATAHPNRPPGAPWNSRSTRVGSTKPLSAIAVAGAASARAAVASMRPRMRRVLSERPRQRFHDRAQLRAAQLRGRHAERGAEAIAEVARRAVAQLDREPRQLGVGLDREPV